MLNGDYVGQDAVVIDVGINVDENGKLCGDVDYDTIQNKAQAATPVPGGVGAVTTAGAGEASGKSCGTVEQIEGDIDMAKVLLINGSGNEHGCTFTALSEAARALNEEGVETEIIQLGKDAIRDCIGCGFLRKAGPLCI